MEKIFSFLIILIFLSITCCQQSSSSGLKPAGEDILTKNINNFTVQDLKKMKVLVKTDLGSFLIAFYPEKAELLVRNFVKLVREGFYDGLTFHMIVPKYMIIGGDPQEDGGGGQGYWIEPQYNDLPHIRGAVGMSHPPFNPDQIGSQFYVLVSNSPVQSNAYPVFGYVESGMDTVDRISEIASGGLESKPAWKPAVKVKIQDMILMIAEDKK